jgi:hypothetical protein
VAVAISNPASGVRNSASTTWVSGSPKRQLNSITCGPAEVSARPTYSKPVNGTPRRASSATTGATIWRVTSAVSDSGAQGSGA